ncbi:MAG: TonB-dependent receptor plug domain-containing protein, partial [Spirochaetales bacterium]|nr:TonB-dependent receptor plug domain-containing protein [Spirochaetales bacterium]
MANLARDYRVQLSFDDHLLSTFIVELHRDFDNVDKAIDFLTRNLPLEVEIIGKVYTIYPATVPEEEISYRYQGQVCDRINGEPLPFAHVLAGKSGLITDFQGNFSFISGSDSLLPLRISYLGYYIGDTLIEAGSVCRINLMPSLLGLEEVVIEGSFIERSGQAGEEAGVLRLNHKIASRLPGNGDNSIFNFLRLQPGILAAGERSSEMIIWGSYSSHSQILFDGITIFGMKNFNDNLSFINPYMSKDIKVLKGGFGAGYGNRVGGIVDITGIEGSTETPAINLNINNMTANGMASLPLGERSSLTLAFRNTYYQLYDQDDLKIITGGRRNSDRVDISVYPDYLFRDFNLKYSGSTSNGDRYFLSLYRGKDHFAYSVDQERNITKIEQDVEEENLQQGASFFFNRIWKKGDKSKFSLAYSGLNRDLAENQLVTRISNTSVISDLDVFFHNTVHEISFKNHNHHALTERHRLEWGLEHSWNRIGFSEDNTDLPIPEQAGEAHRTAAFILDNYRPFPALSLSPGLRMEIPYMLRKIYLEPRIKASLDLGEHFRLNGAWGRYHQYYTESSLVDELGNYRFFWTLCNNEEVPVPEAQHLVGGLTFRHSGFLASLEAFQKTTSGITRVIYRPMEENTFNFQGEARTVGLDLLVKQYFHKHEAWISYTLSRTEELFPYYPEDAYQVSP